MTWYGALFLVLVVVGITVLMKALYGQKDSPTPCIGCGACIATGECVMRRNHQSKGKTLTATPTAQIHRNKHGENLNF